MKIPAHFKQGPKGNYRHGFTTLEGRTKDNPKWRTHYIWCGMKARCDNPNNTDYKNYGGRGITYDPRWKDFQCFMLEMGQAPPDLTIDRIDNNGDYTAKNCRWIARNLQNDNRRNIRYLTLGDVTLSTSVWSKRLGISQRLIRVRLWRGWTDEQILTTPVGGSRPCHTS